METEKCLFARIESKNARCAVRGMCALQKQHFILQRTKIGIEKTVHCLSVLLVSLKGSDLLHPKRVSELEKKALKTASTDSSGANQVAVRRSGNLLVAKDN